MKTLYAAALLTPALLLAACSDEAGEVDTTETGGEAAGELLGGTISDEMLPLEELTSTSPLAPRQTTTTVVTEEEDGSTTVETTVETTTTDAPAPTPPEPPAAPE